MKEIKEYSRKLKEAIDLEYMVEPLKIKIGECEFNLPRKVVDALEKKSKFYEASNIKDIKDNYTMLSKCSFTPLEVCLWALKNSFKFFKGCANNVSPYESEYWDLVDEHPLCPFLLNFNYAIIDNVYIENLEFIKRPQFEACNFDIRDRNNDVINAVFVYYRVGSEDSMNDLLKEQLVKVLNAPESTAFDLEFIALSEHYKVKDIKEARIKRRGKKLRVKVIYRSDEDKNSLEPHYSSIGSKIFQRV